MADETREVRVDVGGIGRARRTPQGFLQISGNLTRTGVLTYARADGSKFRELRHPDEVFRVDSLGSLAFAPVTDRHPPGLVTPANVRDVQVGVVMEARRDGRFVAGDVVVQAQEMIAKISRRDARELSPGYTCRIDHSPGVFEGERYDGIQRDIVYNHLAIGPQDWGRSGRDVSLHLDGETDERRLWAFARVDGGPLASLLAQQADLLGLDPYRISQETGLDEFLVRSFLVGFSYPRDAEARVLAPALSLSAATVLSLVPDAERRDDDEPKERRPMEMITIRIDGVDFEVPRPAAQAVTKQRETLAATAAEAATRAEAATKRADGLEGERDELRTATKELQAKLDAATSPEAVAKLVAGRVVLESSARKILGPEAKLDGLSAREIKVAALKAKDEKFDATSRSDDYVDGRFEALVASAPERRDSRDKVTDVIATHVDPKRQDNQEPRIDTADAAFGRMIEQAEEMGRAPLK